jgi:hypothetical protein
VVSIYELYSHNKRDTAALLGMVEAYVFFVTEMQYSKPNQEDWVRNWENQA